MPIPVIGSQLATFIQQQQGLNHLSQTGKMLTDLLNSSLLTAIAPYTSIVNNSDQTFQFDLHAADTEHFNFDLGLGGKLVTLQSTPDNGDVVSVNVALAFDYLVNFTCHGDNSVTINPAGTNTTIRDIKSNQCKSPAEHDGRERCGDAAELQRGGQSERISFSSGSRLRDQPGSNPRSHPYSSHGRVWREPGSD